TGAPPTAQEAAASFKLPDGFSVQLFASEPEVQQPISFTTDERGRLWIAENYTYAERSQRFQLDLRDRVVIFDNTSGPRFKKRTVFTDNVQMLTGLEVAPDGVWLMCPPKLIFIPDRDHDDVPDSPGEVMLDGFTVAQQNYHNFANGLRFGPDGWLYGRCGGSCPGRIGPPGTPDDQRLALEGGIWRYHPTGKTVEVLTTGTTNPWGHDWNEVGELFFVNTVNGHLWHAIPGAHFTRPFTLDPNRRTYELIDFHADHWHFDTGQSWTKSRDGVANSYGGGHAHSGAMIYRGTNWPEAYRGKLFTLNFHGRRANQESLDRRGSGYLAKHNEDFFVAADPWFRGMDLSAGPGGAVFVIDWSDAGECHEHTGVHRTSGRIFKITHRASASSTTTQRAADLRQWNLAELARAHVRQDAWFVRQARLILAQRARAGQDVSAAITELQRLFQQADHSGARVQTLLTLNIIGGLNDGLLRQWIRHHAEHVRVWAIRLASDRWPLDDALGPTGQGTASTATVAQQSATWLPEFRSMAERDSSPMVRLTLASTLQRLPVETRASLAEMLVRHADDAEDHNLPLMIWYGLIPVAKQAPAQLVEVARQCRLPKTLKLIARCLAEEIENAPQALNALLEHASKQDMKYQRSVLRGVSEGLRGWQRAPKPKSWDLIAKQDAPEIVQAVRELSAVFGDGRALDQLRATVLDADQVEPAIRIAALETLIQSNPKGLRQICQSLLKDQRVNVIAARGLSRFDDPEIGKTLVARYRNFRGNDRPQILSILSSRRSFAKEMLLAIGAGKIPRADLSAYQVRQIHSFGDAQLSRLVSEVWGELRESSEQKQQTIDELKKALTSPQASPGDKANGRKLFIKHCQTCHRLYGEGEKIGPDLTGANRANLDYLLGNIVDPSAVVDKDYRMTILLLDDDRVINGLVTGETDRTLTIQTATELLTFDKHAVVGRKITEKSPMPDGLLDTLSDTQIRDLMAYLQHPSQVTLP
ncbi:MAG: c-type cytochrome, partial [Pirellulales bacterium]|nr:c-type cytochrome [Pirellulales bacterium]